MAWWLIPIGFLLVVFGNKVFEITGEFEFAEKWMPSGGTPAFIKLFGLALMVGSFMWLVGGCEGTKESMGRFF